MECIGIVGLGLMGASLALALREAGFGGAIVGVSRSPATRQKALARGMVDRAEDSLRALAEADLVVLCTPVRTLIAQVDECGVVCKPGAVITDVGSTKRAVVQAMDALPEHVRAVGSHPMCGKETAGIDAADAGLYRGAPWLLVPCRRTDDVARERVSQLASLIGARLLALPSADTHDAVLAFASHLPYALAVSLVTATDQFALNNPVVWEVAASGFRDTSRVAASDVDMWLDILLTNADALLGALRDAQFALDQLIALLERADEHGLRALLTRAAQVRREHFR